MSRLINGARRTYWWLAPELVVIVAVAATGLYLNAKYPVLSADELREKTSVTLSRALETAPPAEHEEHGHVVNPDDKLLCSVEVYGTDPAGAGREKDVERIYGYFLCAAGTPGTPYLAGRISAGPVVLHLGEKPRLQVTTPRGNFKEEVKAMMPAYEKVALKGFTSSRRPRELKERFEREVSALPAATPGS